MPRRRVYSPGDLERAEEDLRRELSDIEDVRRSLEGELADLDVREAAVLSKLQLVSDLKKGRFREGRPVPTTRDDYLRRVGKIREVLSEGPATVPEILGALAKRDVVLRKKDLQRALDVEACFVKTDGSRWSVNED